MNQNKDHKKSRMLKERLRVSEERYRDLFERVRHGLFVSTKEGRFIDCNQAMIDALGYASKEEFLSIAIERDLYVNPGDRKRFQREIEEKGYVKDYEINFKKKNGEKISVLVTCNTLFDKKGEVIGYQGLNIDITGRKRMEREVREATKRFQKISEMGEDGIIVFDKNYRIEFANMMATEVTGFSHEALIGTDFNVLLNERDRKFLASMHSEVGEDEDRRVCVEMKIMTARGETKDVEVCITIAKSEEKGLKTYAYIRDITQRMKMEREILEAHQFLSKVIENSLNCIVATDMKGNILIFNKGAEELLGYKADEVIGQMNIRNIYPPGVAKEVMEKIQGKDYGGVGRLQSYPMIHKNRWGEEIDGSLSASIIYDDTGKAIATVGIFVDLRPRLTMESQLRETQQQLLQSEKLAAMGKLTSQLAHELNNPIYGIMNTLELLKTEIPPASKRRKILDMSLSETQRLSEMLRNMLSFSKPQEEKRSKIDINKLIENVMLILEKQLWESNIKIKTHLKRGLPPITASPNQLRQVILNIVANAKDAMPQGGKLTIETRAEDGYTIIKVKDTGSGISEELRDKIFDAFFTTKQKVQGVGLGLSVCYGIVKDHGGDIRVKSKSGTGSTFSISLPQDASAQ